MLRLTPRPQARYLWLVFDFLLPNPASQLLPSAVILSLAASHGPFLLSISSSTILVLSPSTYGFLLGLLACLTDSTYFSTSLPQPFKITCSVCVCVRDYGSQPPSISNPNLRVSWHSLLCRFFFLCSSIKCERELNALLSVLLSFCILLFSFYFTYSTIFITHPLILH